MADEGIYREVDQELEEEKQVRQLKQSLPWLIVIAVLAVAFVGGRQVWDANRIAAKERNAEAFSSAVAGETPEATIAELETVRDEAPAGYSALASFRISATETGRGNYDAAIAALQDVITNDSLPQRMRDLARVRAGYIGLQIDPDMALRQINGLQESDTPLAMHAKEIAGLAAMEAGHYEQALRYFGEIEGNLEAAPSLRARVTEFAALAEVGQSGGSLEPQSMGDSLQQLLDMPAVPAEAAETAAETDAEDAPETAGTPAPEAEQNETEQDGTSGD